MAKIRQFIPIICALALSLPTAMSADVVAVFAAASLTDGVFRKFGFVLLN